MSNNKFVISISKMIALTFCLFHVFVSSAQNNTEYSKALKLKSEYNYREALPAFQALLKTDSSNVNYLTAASYCYSKFGFYHITDEQKKINSYKIAEALALKAIKISEANADAHYVYAMALGRINENASSKQKIANSKRIKMEADRAIAINPRLAGAHHILGRWHRTVAGFNAVEKAMINSFYGGVPEGGSFDDAVKAFMTAIALEPKFMMHQYELAQTYVDMGKEVEAKLWAEKALEITPASEDDMRAKENCVVLLKQLK